MMLFVCRDTKHTAQDVLAISSMICFKVKKNCRNFEKFTSIKYLGTSQPCLGSDLKASTALPYLGELLMKWSTSQPF